MSNQRHRSARRRLLWRSQDVGTRLLVCCLGGVVLGAMVLAIVTEYTPFFGLRLRPALSIGATAAASNRQDRSGPQQEATSTPDLPALRPAITVGRPPTVRAAA